MNILANAIRLQYDEQHKVEIVLSTALTQHNSSKEYRRLLLDAERLKEIIAKGKLLAVDVKQHREKRSLNANAYAHVLMNEIANVLRADKDDIYLKMLKRYGQMSVVSVIEAAADTFRRSVKYCEDIGETDMQGKHYIHIKVYMGSSEFDTRMMAILIDGIVSEAKELDIETMTPDEISKMKSLWNPS